MPTKRAASFVVMPSAARLTTSLRDIGYDFPTAIADLVDNSVAAGATRISVDIDFDGSDSYVMIADDGAGMSANQLLEALRFGTRRAYRTGDFGRFGLGLKTASLSQCRRLTVTTRRSPVNRVISTRTLDLDIVEEWDRWLIIEDVPSPAVIRAKARLAEGPGTVVIWENLDRIIPDRVVDTGWGRRRLINLARKTAEHLAMVFHRFIEGLPNGRQIVIAVNGDKLDPWNPFAPDEPGTVELPLHTFELEASACATVVSLRRYVLPQRSGFSTSEAFERLSGPMKWNRQQGLYIYRIDRLVQHGGWSGIRAIDEHTKLGRAALDFGTDLDEVFQINVAKMRVNLPPSLKQMLERPVNELCIHADEAYRKTERTRAPSRGRDRGGVDLANVGLAIRMAALESGQLPALMRVLKVLEQRSPEMWRALGLDH